MFTWDLLTVVGIVVTIAVAVVIYTICRRSGCDKPVC